MIEIAARQTQRAFVPVQSNPSFLPKLFATLGVVAAISVVA